MTAQTPHSQLTSNPSAPVLATGLPPIGQQPMECVLDYAHARSSSDAMRKIALISLLILLSACGSSYRDEAVPIAAQADFEAERYLGLWYEIARYPVSFQEGCTATTAEYGALDANTISVLNTCREGAPDGPVDQIAGQAEIVGPGKLEVKFEGVPFVRGDYWVLWVDETYETAVVGVPSGSAGWILARGPEISPSRRAEAEAVLQANGYDVTQLIEVAQPPG